MDALPPNNSNVTDVSEEPAGPLAKRRKLRKGTRSCWECKLRKIRCMFAAPGDATCIGCQHRHVSCVSQQLGEDPTLVRRENPRLGERMARVEGLMNAFLTQREEDGDAGHPSGRPSLASPSASSFRSPPKIHRRESTADSPLSTPDSHAERSASCPAEVDTAARHLLAALPAGEDVQILLRESSRPLRYTQLIMTQPHSKVMLESLAAPYPRLQPPHAGMHPVLLARLMLSFAITLQRPSGEQIEGLSEDPNMLMHRLVSAVRTWVTAREEMHGSLECLMCIMLEGVYEMNGGNLRRAWAAFRRAMAVAQLVGVNCSPVPRRLPRLDAELDADVRFIWFRIVSMDRYLSLLLGLPQGSLDKTMGDASALQNEPPLGRFERLLAVIACRVLERNETTFAPDRLATTQAIDEELLGVSRSMPVSFWRVPSFHQLRPGSPETLLETIRLAAHVYYHGLLIQLHLPYMMQVGDQPAEEYSKITCANSSREIMTRFVAHRTFNPKSSCSRPVDFFAFLAAMTLVLAHLEAAHRLKVAPNVLAHQRLSDWATLEQCLETMDVLKDLNKDPVTGKTVELIRRLMDMEAYAANGGTYATRSVQDDGEEAGDSGSREDGDGVRLSIPYLGVIHISRQDPIS